MRENIANLREEVMLDVIGGAQVICATCVGAGSDQLKGAPRRLRLPPPAPCSPAVWDCPANRSGLGGACGARAWHVIGKQFPIMNIFPSPQDVLFMLGKSTVRGIRS
jgi:hypothetical protein